MTEIAKMVWNGVSSSTGFDFTTGMTVDEVNAWATGHWAELSAVMNAPPPADVQAAMNNMTGSTMTTGGPACPTGATCSAPTATGGPACPTGTNCATTGGPATGGPTGGMTQDQEITQFAQGLW